jgi:hypothetical protein
MVEAAILGRPVLSVLAPEFAATQEGTVHFHYLLPENGGFLRVAQSIEEHVGQLSEVLCTPEVTREQTARFVGTFIRPHGLDTACTPILADALERATRLSPVPVRDTAATRAARIAVWPLAIVLGWAAIGEKGHAVRKAWHSTVRGSRIAVKRGVTRPALLSARLARVTGGKLRRGSRRAAQWTRSVPGRLLRRARHARCQLAVRIRGDAHVGADGNDTRG